MNLEYILQKHFQYDTFRPGQKEIIQSVLEGKNVLGILPTGTGKTLCYHLPAKVIRGMTIIVSPLLSLMEDQVHQLRANGEKNAVQLNGFMSNKEKNYILQSLNERSMLYVSPEMFRNKYVLSYLENIPIGLFVVDEAHCISQWGHEFRTDYLRLKDVIKQLNNPPCLALTATATKRVEEDIITQLNMENPVVHRFSVDRKNIKYFVNEVFSAKEKEERLFQLLNIVKSPAIIYTATRHEAESLCHKMRTNGYKRTAYYHGGMGKDDRLLVQHQFLNGELDYICATNAFGMGINKQDVRTIIHFHIPSSIENYVQEVGRGGRDGNDSLAILIFAKEDRIIPISFIENEFPSENELDVWLSSIKNIYNGQRINETVVKNMFLIDETKWRMVLYYLEEERVVVGNEIMIDRITNEIIVKLKNHFKKRKQEKLHHFQQFETFLASKRCIREGIVRHFGEQFIPKLDHCCGNCGLSVESVIANQLDQKLTKDDNVTMSWQEKLKAILLPHHGGNHFEK